MRTDAQRIAAYNARMLSSLIDPTISAKQTLAVANYGAYATDFYPKQQALRSILDAAGIATSQYFAYEAYNAELYHVSKVASGASAIVMATALHAKYVSYFLATVTLKAIANVIYSIVIP